VGCIQQKCISVILRNVINQILLLELCSEREHIKGWRDVAKKLFAPKKLRISDS